MAATPKITVIYPKPQDEAAFESAYKNQHLPMLETKMKGLSRVVATRVLGSPQGDTKSYRMAELHFPSMDALNGCIESDGAKAVMAHAESISTGGKPIFMIGEEETFLYW